jgi:hypothetical protein
MLETDRISGISQVDLLQVGERDRRFLHASREDDHEHDTRSEGCVWARAQTHPSLVFLLHRERLGK